MGGAAQQLTSCKRNDNCVIIKKGISAIHRNSWGLPRILKNSQWTGEQVCSTPFTSLEGTARCWYTNAINLIQRKAVVYETQAKSHSHRKKIFPHFYWWSKCAISQWKSRRSVLWPFCSRWRFFRLAKKRTSVYCRCKRKQSWNGLICLAERLGEHFSSRCFGFSGEGRNNLFCYYPKRDLHDPRSTLLKCISSEHSFSPILWLYFISCKSHSTKSKSKL